MTSHASITAVEKAVQTDDKLTALKSLRFKLATTIDATNSGREVAALSHQMRLCLDAIEKEEEKKSAGHGTVLEGIIKDYES